MKKLFSLIKASFSQDMDLFKYSKKKNSSKSNKIVLPIILFIFVTFLIGFYESVIGEVLSKNGQIEMLLTISIALVTVLAFVEGIYKSQGILFDSKDTDMLFSMPIKKSHIIFIRIAKLITFEYLFNLMILLPTFIVYTMYAKVTVSFVLLSILMTFLVPLIPTVLSAFIGYFIKMITTGFKSSKIIQTVLSSILFLGIFFGTTYIQNNTDAIANIITNVGTVVQKWYYPLDLYINLLSEFNILNLIILIAISVVPLLLFILIGSKFYFRIISKSNSFSKRSKKQSGNLKFEKRSKLKALAIKEVKRYLSSPVYMLNTSFGLLLGLVGTIFIAVKGEDILNSIFEGASFNIPVFVVFFVFMIITGAMTSITSSCISLEGKSINLTKSMPVKESTILRSKILFCYIIELPFFAICDIIFLVRFMPNIMHILVIILGTLAIILVNACIGLLINLKYPKMDASSDTEVVKQSTSSMISVFLGMGIMMVSTGITFALTIIANPTIAIVVTTSVLLIISVTIYGHLMRSGVKKYKSISV